MKRLCDPAATCPASYHGCCFKERRQRSVVVNSQSMSWALKALDDFTLEITLENPADYFVSMTSMSAFMPVREDLVEKYGNEFGGKRRQTGLQMDRSL